MIDRCAIDACILRSLFGNEGLTPVRPVSRASPRAIAAELGVSERSVRNRLASFSSNGLVREARLIPNPGLAGVGEACAMVNVSDLDHRAWLLKKLRDSDDVLLVTAFHSGLLGVTFRYASEAALQAKVRQLRDMARDDHAPVGRIQFPTCTFRMRQTDWAILRAFHFQPRSTYRKVGKLVGVSERTVLRRLNMMLNSQAAFLFPNLDPAGMIGTMMVVMILQYPIGAKSAIDEAVARACGRRIWHVTHYLPYGKRDLAPCGYNLIVSNLADARRFFDAARRIDGVQRARLELWESNLTRYEVFESILRAGQSAKNRPARERSVVDLPSLSSASDRVP